MLEVEMRQNFSHLFAGGSEKAVLKQDTVGKLDDYIGFFMKACSGPF